MTRLRSLGFILLLGVAVSWPTASRTVVRAQSASLPPGPVPPRSRSGPVSIAMGEGPTAIILGNDGRVTEFDTASARRGPELFRVPSEFVAMDAGTGTFEGGRILCLPLYRRTSSAYRAFLLQLIGTRQVWRSMPSQGVYVGVAVDSRESCAYASNSTDNQIYRVDLGGEKAPVTSVTYVSDADRLGPLALDAAGRRLFAADIQSGSIYAVSLPGGATTRLVTLDDVEEVRALAWHPGARRLLIADSAREAVWIVNPDRPESTLKIKGKELRDPAGLTVSDGGAAWMVDEGARMVFELKVDGPVPSILRGVPW